MPKILITMFLLTISLLSPYQKIPVKVEWGKEFQASRKSTLSDIVGFDELGFYVVRNQYSLGLTRFSMKYSLERFDPQLNSAKSIEVDLNENGRPREMEFVLQLNGHLLLFTSFPDQKTKINTLYVQEVDRNTLLPSPKKASLAEINFEGKNRSNNGSFNYRQSRDKSKLLIYYALPYSSKEPEKFGIKVFDQEMRPLWEKEITLPYKDELFDIETFKVDNDRNVHLLGLLYKDVRKSKRRGEPNYSYMVFSYVNSGNSSKEFPIELPDKFLTDMQIEVRNNKDLICAGFYSDLGKFSIKGTYFLTIDANTKQIKTKSFKEFDLDFITQNMTEREANRVERKEKRGEDVELYEYDLDKLIIRSDGGAMLIGEQYYINTVTQTTYINGRPSTRTITYYHYNDIITININPSGDIQWAIKVPKRQVTSGDGGFYSSYAMSLYKDKIYFVYNDNPKNISYTGIGRMAYFNGAGESVVMLAEVNAKGELFRQPVFGTATVDVITRPKVCEQINSSEMILFGQRRKTQQFARLIFGN